MRSTTVTRPVSPVRASRFHHVAKLAALALTLVPTWSAQAADHPSSALPAAPSTNNEEAVKAAYREGRADYALGHFRDALNKFELAYKLKETPLLLFNIAQCHRQLKEFEEAATTYRSFIRLAPDSSEVELARQLLVQVEAAVKAQNTAQAAPPVDANGHDVPIAAPPAAAGARPNKPDGKPEARPEVIATTKAPPHASPSSPAAAPAQSVASEQQTAASGSRNHIPVWIAGGATVVAIGLGATFGVMSKSTASDISGSQHSRAEVDSLQQKLDSQSSKANLLFAIGGGLALVTGALLVFGF